MSKKKRKNRKPQQTARPTAREDWLTLSGCASIPILARRTISGLEGEEFEPWKTLFVAGNFTEEDERRADELEANLIAASRRKAGRPRRDESPEPDIDVLLSVSGAVRDYLIEHPGAMVRIGQRLRYSDSFKVFALELVAPGGLAASLTLAQAAKAIGMPYHTLTEWTSKHGD